VHNITKGNLKSIVATGNQGVLFSEALKYEINGNIKEQTVQNVSDSYKYTFDYDRINRLTSANSDVTSLSETFSYNDDGGFDVRTRISNNNLIAENNNYAKYVYKQNTHKIESIKDSLGNTIKGVFEFDAKGNVVFDPISNTRINKFDTRNLPLNVAANGLNIHYSYNDAANRIFKIINSNGNLSTEHYIHNSAGNTYAIYKNGLLNRFNIFGSGMCGYITFNQDSTVSRNYFVKDHLGSIRQTIYKNDFSIVNKQDYTPFGEEFFTVTNLPAKYKFTEKERDLETGLDYFGARYYNSKTALWLSVDPLAEKYHGWSPFNYTVGNPLRLIDPDGESSIKFDGTKNRIWLYSNEGKLIASFRAHNNVTNSSQGKWEDGLYEVSSLTKTRSYMHGEATDKNGIKKDSKNGSYGKNGIILAKSFTQTDKKKRNGMGIHAGRANKKFLKRVTEGCIRLESDDHMKAILSYIKRDALETIEVVNNKKRIDNNRGGNSKNEKKKDDETNN